VGVHETTVSRAIANKYVQTRSGFRPEILFHARLPDGQRRGDVEHEREGRDPDLIGRESSHKPLSDQEIVKILSERAFRSHAARWRSIAPSWACCRRICGGVSETVARSMTVVAIIRHPELGEGSVRLCARVEERLN